MTRNDFLRTCAVGVCCCASRSAAQPESKPTGAQVRFAKLLEILNHELDPAAKKRVFQALGRACAGEYKELTDKYRNNLRGFLDLGRKEWMESAEYDETAGTIRVVDRSRNCSCPLVAKSLTPGDFCECTLGWQKAAYAAITGRPVEAELEESVLRGGSRCVFRIRIL
jgi:predicted hydrocarbon binding protein